MLKLPKLASRVGRRLPTEKATSNTRLGSPSLSPAPHPSSFNPKNPTFLPPTRSKNLPRAQTAPREGPPVWRRRCVAGLSRGRDWEMGMLGRSGMGAA